MQIVEALTSNQIMSASVLFREYQSFVGGEVCFQGFENELANLPGKYAYPTGAILLAKYRDEIIGCVAIRQFKDDICEMKRLYVKPDYHGLSAGRKLTESAIEKAKLLGYRILQLDTLRKLETAINLYAKLGFKEVQLNNEKSNNEVVYWRFDLIKD